MRTHTRGARSCTNILSSPREVGLADRRICVHSISLNLNSRFVCQLQAARIWNILLQFNLSSICTPLNWMNENAPACGIFDYPVHCPCKFAITFSESIQSTWKFKRPFYILEKIHFVCRTWNITPYIYTAWDQVVAWSADYTESSFAYAAYSHKERSYIIHVEPISLYRQQQTSAKASYMYLRITDYFSTDYCANIMC